MMTDEAIATCATAARTLKSLEGFTPVALIFIISFSLNEHLIFLEASRAFLVRQVSSVVGAHHPNKERPPALVGRRSLLIYIQRLPIHRGPCPKIKAKEIVLFYLHTEHIIPLNTNCKLSLST